MDFTIDVVALRWGIFIFVFFLSSWVILARLLLKSEPKAVKVNLAWRYEDLSYEDLKTFGILTNDIKKIVYDNFIKIHNAFMEYDYNELKKYLTNDLCNYYVEQLEILKDKNYKNILKDFKLLNIKIYQVTNRHGMLVIDVYLNVRMFDYMIDMSVGNCIKGKEDVPIDYEFELSFVKNEENNFLLCKKSCVNDIKKDK